VSTKNVGTKKLFICAKNMKAGRKKSNASLHKRKERRRLEKVCEREREMTESKRKIVTRERLDRVYESYIEF